MGPTAGDSARATCCFCHDVIRVSEDEYGMQVQLAPMAGSKVMQVMWTHSSCLRDRLHPHMAVWWE
ncbi:hypothetical protein ACFQZ4_09870 [Catellatospora coxensis]|uniref:PARP-type domain-containing protein n=1 Tax=Catellatospora coxensis TaxID=310354 RepID=A0A8J3KXB6_9ACTN|nr:hypothetical protein Cco03nite_71030 [Catellatospora coxensis]